MKPSKIKGFSPYFYTNLAVDKAALLYQNRKSKSVSQMSAISLRVNLCA